MNEIVVAGAGVFGTSVAERLAWNRNNHVILHTIETDVMEDINTNHQNTKYFPTKFLNPGITATDDDMKKALRNHPGMIKENRKRMINGFFSC